MAVRFEASTDRLVRTTGVIDYQSTFAWGGWFYIVSFPSAGNFATIMSINRDVVGGGEDGVYVQDDGQLEAYVEHSDATFSEVTGTTLSTGVWYHLLMVRESATSLKVYLNGVLDITNTKSNAGRTGSSRMEVGGFSASTSTYANIRAQYMKAWTASKTAAEVQVEVQTALPRIYTALYAFWPLFSGSGERARDYSANGRNWTEAGTLTDEDGPGVGWGAPALFTPMVSAPALNQEGYRFRNDDGSESTATWQAAQDTPVTVSPNTPFRLRVTVKASGDPPGKTFRLQYKRSTEPDAAYRNIAVKQ